MYNYLLNRMYAEYTTQSNGDVVDFMKGTVVVGSLYKKQQVLNIFLSASRDVVWNHHNLAIFVLAKKYTVLNNAKVRSTEAAWLIGCCGAQWQKNLNNPMYLENGKFWGDKNVAGITKIYSNHNGVRFTIFDVEIEWQYEKEQPHSHISYLNPALIYPVKPGGKKIKRAKSYLRKEYDWEYGNGYNTAGSYETREFIDNFANKVNHTDFSIIRYHKIIRK